MPWSRDPHAGPQEEPGRWVGGFLALCLGQSLAILGSVLAGFALEVWVFRTTGSVTKFALLSFFSMAPGILLTPLAGIVVDRWNRRRVMIWSNLGVSAGTLALALLFWSGRASFGWIGVLLAVCSAFSILQPLALAAAIPQLVPPMQWGRANGMVQFSGALAPLLGPFLGGVLLETIHVRGVIVVDLAALFLAILTLLLVRIPSHRRDEEPRSRRVSLWQEQRLAWLYVRERRGLMGMLLLFAALNFGIGTVQTLITPLVLGFASPVVLGTVLSSASLGMVAGGIWMTVWGGPERRLVEVVLVLFAAQGALIMIGGVAPNAPLITVASFLYLLCVPIITACSQTIWQRKIPTELQGRAFALRQLIARSALLPAYLLAGPLADFVFEPLLAPQGPLAGSVGRMIGVGPGRGIALLFMSFGAAMLVAAAAAFRVRSLRELDRELPDVGLLVHPAYLDCGVKEAKAAEG
jgi:MFS family permease